MHATSAMDEIVFVYQTPVVQMMEHSIRRINRPLAKKLRCLPTGYPVANVIRYLTTRRWCKGKAILESTRANFPAPVPQSPRLHITDHACHSQTTLATHRPRLPLTDHACRSQTTLATHRPRLPLTDHACHSQTTPTTHRPRLPLTDHAYHSQTTLAHHRPRLPLTVHACHKVICFPRTCKVMTLW